MREIFLSPPNIGKNELKYVKEVFKSNYIAPLGEWVDKFEASIKSYCGVKYALALNSATSGIHLALKVLNLKPNDYVLVSNFTFVASANPILYEKCEPVFIDCDESWNLDPNLLKKAIKTLPKKPKVLIVTHLYGSAAKMDKISEICKNEGIFIIEDAAEALGAKFGDKFLGTIGDLGVYSFNGNKIITTSGGGMLVSNNENFIKKARFYATQSRENRPYYEHKEIGYNYRLSNILGAVGVGQMENLATYVAKKRKIFEIYKNELKMLDFMPEIENSFSNRWLSVALFAKKGVNLEVIRALKSEKIESRHLWKPMNLQPLFAKNLCFTNGISCDYFGRGICLASGSDLKKYEILKISSIVKRFL